MKIMSRAKTYAETMPLAAATNVESGARLFILRKKLAARKGVGIYAENCKAIEAEIARLEALAVKPISD
jgi:cytochrome c1